MRSIGFICVLGGNRRKKMAENDFQKITHKKSKGAKGGKNDQLYAGEDGDSFVQVLVALSSYFFSKPLPGISCFLLPPYMSF